METMKTRGARAREKHEARDGGCGRGAAAAATTRKSVRSSAAFHRQGAGGGGERAEAAAADAAARLAEGKKRYHAAMDNLANTQEVHE